MDRTAADAHMASERLTYEDASDLAEDNYRKLKDKAGKKGNNRGKKADNNKPKGNKKEDTNWKKVAPGPGEPQQKVVNGKTWKYSAHCICWSTTHGTDGHTGPRRS
ncbi:unnamed protein product [Cylindrotheca closterium]|uniref:Uncharacterized protein n=1 Tax=Cylindrotheca closterium TaxID=2856 RepID=A0AAD2G2D4_9STRA|nr:unnamed protein product [Cylindrotheca closterium]